MALSHTPATNPAPILLVSLGSQDDSQDSTKTVCQELRQTFAKSFFHTLKPSESVEEALRRTSSAMIFFVTDRQSSVPLQTIQSLRKSNSCFVPKLFVISKVPIPSADEGTCDDFFFIQWPRDARWLQCFVTTTTESFQQQQEIESLIDESHFRADLAERLNALSSPDEVIAEASEALARRLRASRCFAAEIDDQKALATVHQDYAAGLPTLKGTHDLLGFGPKLLKSWRRDPVVMVSDVYEDARTIDFAENHVVLGIRSFISIRILRNGTYIGVVNITSDQPRLWTEKEAELTRSISESVWSAFESVRLQKALRDSESVFKNLANSLPQIVWTCDAIGQVLFYNQRWTEYTGFAFTDHASSTVAAAVHPDDAAVNVERWEKARLDGQTFENEYRLRSKEGTYHWFLGRAVPVRDSRGHIVQWFGTATDIDAQKRFSESQHFLSEITSALAGSLDYQKTLEQVAKLSVPSLADWCSIEILEAEGPRHVAVAHTDPALIERAHDLRTEYPTDWESPSGVPNVLRTGKSELYPHISTEMLAERAKDDQHRKLLENMNMRSAMIVPLTARGQTIGALTLVASESLRVFDEKSLEFAEEVGRRAGIAVDNARLFQQAQQAIRMRDEFLSVASHELKTPLTSLKLQYQIFTRQLGKNDRTVLEPNYIQNVADVSLRQVNQLTRLVEDMLDVSRIESGRFDLDIRPIDLSKSIREVVGSLQGQFDLADVTIQMQLTENLEILCDKVRFEQVLTNLLTNALKYGGGNPVQITTRAEDANALIEVKDQGLGISKENVEKIFNRYERAIPASAISGLGLGLYIARQITEAHHGKIAVQSELGKGSTFLLRWPKPPLADKFQELS